jgi:hypothetical protein
VFVKLRGIDSRSLYEATAIDENFVGKLLDISFPIEMVKDSVVAWATSGNLHRIVHMAEDAVWAMKVRGLPEGRMRDFILLCMEVANEVE